MYVCMYVCMYIYVCVWKYLFGIVLKDIRMYICADIALCMYIRWENVGQEIQYMYVCMYIQYVCKQLCMYICMYACMSKCVPCWLNVCACRACWCLARKLVLVWSLSMAAEALAYSTSSLLSTFAQERLLVHVCMYVCMYVRTLILSPPLYFYESLVSMAKISHQTIPPCFAASS